MPFSFFFPPKFKSGLKLHINCLLIAGGKRIHRRSGSSELKLIPIFQINSSNFQIVVEKLRKSTNQPCGFTVSSLSHKVIVFHFQVSYHYNYYHQSFFKDQTYAYFLVVNFNNYHSVPNGNPSDLK